MGKLSPFTRDAGSDRAYLRGAYRLGSNEDDQLGYRLARRCGLPTIYPIDSTTHFPFDYDLIGGSSTGYTGEVLTSNWYGRNLQIFANIGHALLPGDRAVVFIGQGHAAMLRPMIERSPFLRDVDPEKYLPTH